MLLVCRYPHLYILHGLLRWSRGSRVPGEVSRGWAWSAPRGPGAWSRHILRLRDPGVSGGGPASPGSARAQVPHQAGQLLLLPHVPARPHPAHGQACQDGHQPPAAQHADSRARPAQAGGQAVPELPRPAAPHHPLHLQRGRHHRPPRLPLPRQPLDSAASPGVGLRDKEPGLELASLHPVGDLQWHLHQ